MTPSMPPLLRRGLALAILIAVLGAAWSLGAVPLLESFRDYREDADQSRLLLARYARLGAGLADLEARRAELDRRRQTGGRVLAAASPALAAAQLQNDVKRLIGGHGGSLKSTQVIAGGMDGPFRKVTVRVSMNADIESLQRIFYGLETAHIYRFVENVEIRARVGRRRVAAGTATTPLDVRFDVFAYMREEGT